MRFLNSHRNWERLKSTVWAQQTNGQNSSDAAPTQEPQPLTLGGAAGRTSSAPPAPVDVMAAAMPESVSSPIMRTLH